MKASSKEYTNRDFPIEQYKEQLNKAIGKEITIKTFLNKRNEKIVKGTLEYVSNDIFGIRIFKSDTSYVTSFKFSDIFINNIQVFVKN